MADLKIPDSHGKKAEFEVKQLSGLEVKAAEPGEKVKVRFKNFVHLVATHDFEVVMEDHADEDIIVSTNLLTDLANAHEEMPDEHKKIPMYIVLGIIIGIAATYLITRLS